MWVGERRFALGLIVSLEPAGYCFGGDDMSQYTSSAWTAHVADVVNNAGASLGLQPADYKKQIAHSWQMQPLAGLGAWFKAWTYGCAAGNWQGRPVSVTMKLPMNSPAGYNLHPLKPNDWSERQILITSVRFTSGVIPFMMAAPNEPFRINEHKTYTNHTWLYGITGDDYYGQEVPVPGDTEKVWRVRAIQAERPAAIVAAIAPTLLSEQPYPWRIDGGKKGAPVVDDGLGYRANPEPPPRWAA
jgi:hypothetical protein